MPENHAPVKFPWRTDFFLWLIAEDPKMTEAGHLLSAFRADCTPCTRHWAKHVIKEDPLAIAHLLGSGYEWVTQQTKMTFDELSSREPVVYREASAGILKIMLDEDVSRMVSLVKKAPPDILSQILYDALSSFGAPRRAEGPRGEIPPPWVTAMDEERKTPRPDIAAIVKAFSPPAPPPPVEQIHHTIPAPPPPEPPQQTQTGTPGTPPPPRFASPITPPGRISPRVDEGALGVIHVSTEPQETPAPEEPQKEEAPAPALLSLEDVRRRVGDPEGTWTAQATQKGKIRALLWQHRGDTVAVRHAWRDAYATAPPSAIYRHAQTWTQDLVRALAKHHHHSADAVRGEVDRLGIRRTRAVEVAITAAGQPQ